MTETIGGEKEGCNLCGKDFESLPVSERCGESHGSKVGVSPAETTAVPAEEPGTHPAQPLTSPTEVPSGRENALPPGQPPSNTNEEPPQSVADAQPDAELPLHLPPPDLPPPNEVATILRPKGPNYNKDNFRRAQSLVDHHFNVRMVLSRKLGWSDWWIQYTGAENRLELAAALGDDALTDRGAKCYEDPPPKEPEPKEP